MLVPPHPVSPILLRMINWAQPEDPNKKYPNLGRLRYVWMSEDYMHIKILLKDGPSSWSENKDIIEAQIKGHESFVSLEVLERDPVYVVATFKPLESLPFDNADDIKGIFKALIKFDDALDKTSPNNSMTIDPFVKFDKALNDLSSGKTEPTKEMIDVVNKIKDSMENNDGSNGIIIV